MHIKEWLQKWYDESYIEIYDNLPEKQKRIATSEIEDAIIIESMPEIISIYNKFQETSPKIVAKHIKDQLIKHNIGKVTSKKSQAILYNKYHRVHLGYDTRGNSIGFLLYVMGLKGIQIIGLLNIKTKKGDMVFEVRKVSSGLAINMYQSHLWHRYKERADIPECNVNERMTWLLKEIANSDLTIEKEYSRVIDNLIVEGHFALPLQLHIATGMLLGSSYAFGGGMVSHVNLFRTFISTDLFSKSQDKAHQEAWDRILEECKKARFPLPLV